MKVFITDPAKASLKDIHDYYQSKGYGSYGKRITKSVISKSKSLSNNPYIGQEEELLRPCEQGHRYLLVEKHYKVIYLVTEEAIMVTDVFDTRQHPEKMLKRHQ